MRAATIAAIAAIAATAAFFVVAILFFLWLAVHVLINLKSGLKFS